MQAQYNIPPCPPIDYYHPIPNTYSTVPDQYLATSGGDNFAGSFSRGSSLAYPYEDYRFFTDRGGPPSASVAGLSSMSFAAVGGTAGIGFDATGLGFTESTATIATPTSVSGREYCHPEDIPGHYGQAQGWQWEYRTLGQVTPALQPHPPHLHPLSHPHPHVPSLPQLRIGALGALPPDPAFLDLAATIKSAVTVGQSQPYPVRSPTAQLPTPAAMAVLLNPNGRRKEQTPQIMMDAALSDQQSAVQMSPSVADVAGVMPVPDILSREKKHACTMCHKRFDRPSTLRKHLLVHTGEKAFVCETCGRRFGVASNLNRHVRRCILKPVNATAVNPAAPGSPPSGGNGIPSITAVEGDQDGHNVGTAKRGRALSSTGSTASSSSTSSSSSNGQLPSNGATGKQDKLPGQKRRRRAPSPSLWVPWSLRTFDLTCEELYLSTSMPLPPVRRNLPREERDSWDENVSSTPYHPQEWKEVLPGPGLGHGLGLGGKDVRNINFGGSGGIMLGRVLVF